MQFLEGGAFAPNAPSWIRHCNGVELYYDSRGNGDHALVCIPGFLGTTRSAFAPQLDYFGSREDFKIVAFDPRGHGYSRPPRRVYSGISNFESDAKDAKGLMDALGIKEFSVLGSSYGGIAALILASLYPNAVKTLSVWGAMVRATKEDTKLLQAFRDVSKWKQNERELFEQEYGKDELQALANECFGEIKENCYSGGDICTGVVSNIKCPTLILHGVKDPMVTKSHPDHLLKHIPGSVVHNFDEGRHHIQLSHAKEFNQVVEAFLKKYGNTTPSSKL